MSKAKKLRRLERRQTSAPAASAAAPASTLRAPRPWLAWLALAGAGFLVYANSFSASFHLDDDILTGTPVFRDVANIGTRLWQYQKDRFLPNATFVWNIRQTGFEVFPFHLWNLLIHIAAAVCVYGLTLVTLRTPRAKTDPLAAHAPAAAFFAGLLFLAHPLQTQAVTYIIQRYTSMAALFYLSAVLFYARARLDRRPFDHAACAVSCLAAYLCKPIAFTLPAALLLYEIAFFSGSRKSAAEFGFLGLLAFFTALIVFGVLYHGATFRNLAESVQARRNPPPRLQYLLTEINVLRTYLRLLFLPVRQNFDYDYPLSKSFFEPATLGSFALLASLATSGCALLRSRPLVGFGIVWFFVTLSVESSLLPLEDVIFEHRLYLPMFGFALAAVSLAPRLLGGVRRAWAVLGALVLVFSILTLRRNEVWHDEVRLWEDVLKKSPRKTRAYVNLGNAYLHTEPLKAKEYYERALAIDPRSSESENALGAVFYARDEYGEAIRHYLRALEIDPLYADAEYNLALAYKENGELDKALERLRGLAETAPDPTLVYNELGLVYRRKGDADKALAAVQEGLKKSPESKELLENLASIWIDQGEREKAREVIEDLARRGYDESAEALTGRLGKTREENAAGVWSSETGPRLRG